MTEDLDGLVEAIRRRFHDLGPQACRRESFLAHLRALATWESDRNDYPDPGEVSFPEDLSVACAVCHPECGQQELIVDGSTQECQRCGSRMFRTEVASYRLVHSGGE